MKRISIILILLSALTYLYSQDIPLEITQSFEKGNAKSLSRFFNNNIELKFTDKEYVTSSSQAMRILQSFFKTHPPLSFTVNAKKDKSEAKYGFGTLETKKGTFKVTMYFLDGKDNKLIYYLSIEEN